MTDAQLKKWIKAACQLPFEFTLRLVNAKEGLSLNQMYRQRGASFGLHVTWLQWRPNSSLVL